MLSTLVLVFERIACIILAAPQLGQTRALKR